MQSSVGNQYTGFFSYDDSSISFSDPTSSGGLGYVTLPTEFSLNFNNINYTVADLFPYRRGAGGTLLQFTQSGDSFQLTSLSLAAQDPGSTSSFNLNIFQNIASGFDGFLYFGDGAQGSGNVTSSLRPQAVPESDTVLGIGVLGFFGWLLKKKKASSKRV